MAMVLILVNAPVKAQAADTHYYVDSVNGRDRNDGRSESSAWQTMDAIYDHSFGPGDVIHLKRGSVWECSGWPSGLNIDGSGTEANPIRVEPYGDGARPTIRAINSSWGVGIDLEGDWVVIEGLLIETATHFGAEIYGNHNVLRDLEITDAGMGVSFKGDHNLVTDCYIHDLHMYRNTPGGDDDCGAVGVLIAGDYNEVAHNRLVDCIAPSYDYGVDGGAVEFWDDSTGAYIHHNWAEGNDGFMELGGGTVRDARMSYNVSINNGVFSVVQLEGTFAANIEDLAFENNTIIENEDRGEWGWSLFWFHGQPGGEASWRNNVIYIRDYHYVANVDGNNWDVEHENNLYYMPNGGQLGFSLGANEIVSDPRFVDLDGGDLRLESNSAAKDAGLDLGYTQDLDGMGVPAGGAPDLGAYEIDGSDGDEITVSGKVTFWQSGEGVPDVLIKMEGGQVASEVSDGSGSYALQVSSAGDYVVTSSKDEDYESISSYDAAMVLRSLVGLAPLGDHALKAADADASGSVTAMDAHHILQKASGAISLPFPGNDRIWDFDPSVKTYDDLNQDLSGQDFVAILVGDVSGNWGSAGGAAGEELAGTPVEIEIEQKLSDDGEMELLVWVKPNGQEIYSLDLELDYDGADMNTLEIKQGSDSTFASSEAGVDDHLRIAMASATPLTSDALLMSISVQADGLGQVAAVANEQTANVHVEMNEPAMSLVRSAAIPGRALH